MFSVILPGPLFLYCSHVIYGSLIASHCFESFYLDHCSSITFSHVIWVLVCLTLFSLILLWSLFLYCSQVIWVLVCITPFPVILPRSLFLYYSHVLFHTVSSHSTSILVPILQSRYMGLCATHCFQSFYLDLCSPISVTLYGSFLFHTVSSH